LDLNREIKNERSERYCALYLAKTLTQLGEFSEADQYYKQAEELAKKNWPGRLTETWNEWGWNELQEGNQTQAKKFFEDAFTAAGATNSNLSKFYLSIAQSLESGRMNLAQMNEWFQSFDPDLQLQLTPLMAFVMVHSNEPQKAVELLQMQIPKASRKPVTRWLLLSQMANLQRKLGNEKEASQASSLAQELSNQLKLQPKGKVTQTILKT
jgi:tetratricopeptide (TPR) repeat protein